MDIVKQAKKEVAQEQAARKVELAKAGYTPWYINLLNWLADVAAGIIILGLAIIGAKDLLSADMDWKVQVGLAMLAVGFLAVRLIDRVFKK